MVFFVQPWGKLCHNVSFISSISCYAFKLTATSTMILVETLTILECFRIFRHRKMEMQDKAFCNFRWNMLAGYNLQWNVLSHL